MRVVSNLLVPSKVGFFFMRSFSRKSFHSRLVAKGRMTSGELLFLLRKMKSQYITSLYTVPNLRKFMAFYV